MNSEPFPLHAPTLDSDGMVAFHDQACPVYHQEEKSVYDCNDGIFQPSWKAQQEGWIMVQAKTRFQRWLLKTFFGEVPATGTYASLQRARVEMMNKYPEKTDD